VSFIAKLPNSEPLREQTARTLQWCAGDHDYFSNVSFQQRNDEGIVEIFRHLGTPDRVIRFIFRMRPVIFAVLRLIRRVARRQQQA
jgi:hypothetical protein